ncbi:MAG: MaoC family dehydratase N-terminal domain-containing protein [Myxococcaceae bacterium]
MLKNAVVEGRLEHAPRLRPPPAHDRKPPRRDPAGKGLDPRFIGREYGPFEYEAGVEKMREFAYAVGGGVPSTGFSGRGAPAGLHPWYFDRAAAAASPWGSIIAMPNFCVAWAITPFARACADQELQVNLLRLVHGEQTFEFIEPVRPGDVLVTRGAISHIETRRNLDFLEVTTETKNQHGRLVVRGTWTAIIRG